MGIGIFAQHGAWSVEHGALPAQGYTESSAAYGGVLSEI